jgi:hypothetical protein
LDYKKTRADLEIGLVSTGVDVGPAIYLARTFGTDIDTVVKFFIFILIFVFDPLAVMLVIAYNQALMDRNKQVRDDTSIIEKDASTPVEENNPNPYGDDDYATPIFDEEEVIEEPNEPLEENNPTPVEVKPPTAKGGIRIR